MKKIPSFSEVIIPDHMFPSFKNPKFGVEKYYIPLEGIFNNFLIKLGDLRW
ncbi:hypothetical protein [Halobacillus amylolyticus]|uniref:Uncharacterized protein n=1 Tax=Halobacillus amylolyticus TaxID=2932259 RepID=A0ABY4HF77_9BACI|nr:hypothetical protein [Halobacillus amylolyticus]UOR12080.1 hypothetical protein MUO15_00605 [Halobacillus amylolyticus]